MRISTAQLFNQSITSISSQQAQLARTQNQLASGERILKPSDDPSGNASMLRLSERLELTSQFQENIDYARNRLSQEEGALDRAIDILQRARELTVAANDGVLSRTERSAIAIEVEQRLKELVDVANSSDASGEFIFAGFRGRSVPFTQAADGTVSYNGDQGERQVQIGSLATLQVADSGFAAFAQIRNGNGVFAVRPDAANAGAGVMDPGSVTDISLYDSDTYTVRMTQDAGVTGGAIGIVDAGTNDTLGYELRINGVLVDTLAEGDSRTLVQLETAIDAASGASGVEAFVDGGRLFLSATSPGTSIDITETLTGASEDTDTVQGFFGATLTGLASPSRTSQLGPDANAYVVLNSANAIETSGTYVPEAGIDFKGIRTSVRGAAVQGDRFTVTPSVNQSVFSTLGNLVNDLGLADAPLGNALNRALTDVDGALDNLVALRSRVGVRLNTLDAQENENADLELSLETFRSQIGDLDYAEAASRMNRELLSLQAAQQAFVRVQNLSLLNFL